MRTGVLVVGAGPAGIAAAVRAAEAGADVTVVDDNASPGGQIWRGAGHSSSHSQSKAWLRRLGGRRIDILPRAQLIAGDYASRMVLVETSEDTLEVRFEKLILATGAREIFLPFPGWTLPGIFGVGALQSWVKSGLPVAGKRVVVAGTGPLLLAVAAYLRKKGAHVSLIAEQTPRNAVLRFASKLLGFPSKLRQALALRSSLLAVQYRFSCWIEGAEGASRLRQVTVRQGGTTWTEACEYAAVAYGLYPNTELARLLGCEMEGSAVEVDELQRTSRADVYCAGECTGIGGVDLALAEGEIAGLAAAGGAAERVFAKRESARRCARVTNETFALRSELRQLPLPETLVCRCEDVSYARMRTFPSFRAAKLHTRCGMGSCQGRVCGPAAEFLFRWQNDSVRPPVFPARIGSLARNICPQ